MNKKITKFGFLAAIIALVLSLTFAFAACGGGSKGGDGKKPPVSDKTVSSVSVKTNPTKTEYEVGDTLDLTGGELLVTYTDNSTDTVAMTSSDVTLVSVGSMNKTGKKQVVLKFGTTEVMFSITVVAAKINVTFDYNYTGAPDGELIRVSKDEKVTAPETDPTRTGYRFLGWFVAADGNTLYNFDNEISEETTIYAHWAAVITVTFDNNYEGAPAATSVSVDEGSTVSAPETAPTRTGYTFLGWYTDSAAQTAFNFTAPVSASVTLYAGWISADTTVYTVTMHYVYPDGTSATDEYSVISGNKLTAPTAPTFEESTFEGWYSDETLATAYDFNVAVSSNLDLYTKWTINKYLIKYHMNHANDSSVYKTFKGNVSGTQRLSAIIGANNPTPELAGYYLFGWYTEPECVHPFTDRDLSKYCTSYMNLYARWVKNYTFEAEYTNLDGKRASGSSFNGEGVDMLVMHVAQEGFNASNGFWVANLHYQGSFITFEFESDTEVNDAILVLRLSADLFDIELTTDNYSIALNGTELDYAPISLTGTIPNEEGGQSIKRPFTDHVITMSLHLVAGKNTLTMTALDSVKYGDFGSMEATAPIIDCIYVNTDATLTWNPVLSNIPS